ncbi:MAG: hypothetical protein WAS24_07860 [Thermoplasmata archaeon]
MPRSGDRGQGFREECCIGMCIHAKGGLKSVFEIQLIKGAKAKRKINVRRSRGS